jgi:hypothetical protein
MNHLLTELDLKDGDVLEVSLDGQANVLLLDPANYDSYRNGQSYRYFGGHAVSSPVRLAPPRGGKWYLVVDLGGYAGHVEAGVRLLRGTEAVGSA